MSWNPLAAEVTVARRVIAFLGDRRVLFADESIEVLEHCVRSAHVGERSLPRTPSACGIVRVPLDEEGREMEAP